MTRQQELAKEIGALDVPALTVDFLQRLSLTVLLNIRADLETKRG